MHAPKLCGSVYHSSRPNSPHFWLWKGQLRTQISSAGAHTLARSKHHHTLQQGNRGNNGSMATIPPATSTLFGKGFLYGPHMCSGGLSYRDKILSLAPSTPNTRATRATTPPATTPACVVGVVIP